MNILAIDTSTEACSAALSINRQTTERFEIAPRGHGDLILQMIDELLAEAGLTPQQLDLIAFGRGPGAFTGVRIATSVVQGIAFGADLPVVPVSTLAVLAQGGFRLHGYQSMICAMDARMGEVYWGAYTVVDGVVSLSHDECVVAPDVAPIISGTRWCGVGSGWNAYQKVLETRYGDDVKEVDGDLLPRASDMMLLAERAYAAGEAVSAEQALPVYLRDKVVNRP